jgi:hypothetical protein
MEAATTMTNQTMIPCSSSLQPLALISRTQLHMKLPAAA